jgi:predicted nuclease of restriction endonuclease-like (RecB) superfamily
MPSQKPAAIYERVRQILESARAGLARSVNSAQVLANWLIGREIVEEEQKGASHSRYGEKIITALSARLQREYGHGYSATNLKLFRQFYLAYPNFRPEEIGHTAGDQSSLAQSNAGETRIGHTACDRSWQPGQWHPGLSWSLYRHLLRVESADARAFYEIEAIRNAWAARELDRQINSLLFDRLAKSKDKAGLLKLARKGQEIVRAIDVFKDPVIIEFLGLPESSRLVESELEDALISNLQAFLLELGKGFAFVARQRRITVEGDHFYIDLVFYHTILKVYILLDLKIGKLTHQDLGQLQLYVNYFDREICTPGDNPTLGLILCTDKNDTVVKYTLGQEQQKQIFTSRYKLHLPTESELQAELRRELTELRKC